MGSFLTHMMAAGAQPGRPRPRLFALRPREGVTPLSIGLVNNVADGALASTERQIRALLNEASLLNPIKLSVFMLNNMKRGEVGRRYMREQTEGPEALWETPLDALIVTGADPQAKRLPDEPYWDEFTRLVDWAEENTVSAIWSCLAAHVAVEHVDGVERHRLGGKLSGVFECAPAWRTAAEPRGPGFADRRAARREKDLAGELLAHMPRHWLMPHSRLHDLPRDPLRAAGYEMLAISEGAGVDLFARQRKSLFVFMQGHPEYDAQTLLREYRRELTQFYAGKSEYPAMPAGYFDSTTERLVDALQSRALRDSRIDPVPLLAEATYGAVLRHRWQAAAVTLFTNWLAAVATRREAREAAATTVEALQAGAA